VDGKEPGVKVAGDAAGRLERAEVGEGLTCPEGIVIELPPVEDPRLPRPFEHVAVEEFGPEVLDLGAFRKEPVAADVEAEVEAPGRRRTIDLGARDAADEFGMGLDHRHRDAVTSEQPGGGEPGGARADDGHVGTRGA